MASPYFIAAFGKFIVSVLAVVLDETLFDDEGNYSSEQPLPEAALPGSLAIDTASRGILQVTLQTSQGHFVSVEPTDEGDVTGNPDNRSMPFTLLRVERGKIAISSPYNKYLSVKANGVIRADKTRVGEREIFLLEKISDDSVAFKADNGKYVRSKSENAGWQLKADSNDPKAFKLELPPPPQSVVPTSQETDSGANPNITGSLAIDIN